MAAAAIGIAWRNGPGWHDDRLSASARELLLPIGDALLDGLLPADPQARATDLQRWLDTVQDTVAALPGAAQAEFSQMIGVLAHPVGRWGLAHLPAPWLDAERHDVVDALEAMRHSALTAPQQIYHALRDLAAAAYAADASYWSRLHYPGPNEIGERTSST